LNLNRAGFFSKHSPPSFLSHIDRCHLQRELSLHSKLGGIINVQVLYRVGDRKEPCGTLACISLGVDISPSTETLNFCCERNDLIILIKLVENCNLDNL
jgi:hypothetical protein